MTHVYVVLAADLRDTYFAGVFLSLKPAQKQARKELEEGLEAVITRFSFGSRPTGKKTAVWEYNRDTPNGLYVPQKKKNK